MAEAHTLEVQVRRFLAERFLFDAEAAIPVDESLLSAGVLDSTGAMELVLYLEDEIGIEVRDEDLVPENLDTIARIAAFVTRKRAGAAAPSHSGAVGAPSGGNGASDADAR